MLDDPEHFRHWLTKQAPNRHFRNPDSPRTRSCPLACYLQEAWDTTCAVGSHSVAYYDGRATQSLPPWARTFVWWFDREYYQRTRDNALQALAAARASYDKQT